LRGSGSIVRSADLGQYIEAMIEIGSYSLLMTQLPGC
jgi:hypothetical protein